MHTLAGDLIVLWVTAIALIFAIFLFSAASIQDDETYIFFFGGIGIVFLAAIVITVGQLIGWIGVW
jgi:hypothetical protein